MSHYFSRFPDVSTPNQNNSYFLQKSSICRLGTEKDLNGKSLLSEAVLRSNSLVKQHPHSQYTNSCACALRSLKRPHLRARLPANQGGKRALTPREVSDPLEFKENRSSLRPVHRARESRGELL